MKKSILLVLAFLTVTSLFGQKKIGNKIYLYGNVNGSLKGNVMLYFPDADPKTEIRILNMFTLKGANALSYNNLFLPGAVYSDSEFMTIVNESKIEGILLVSVSNVSIASYNYSNTSTNTSAHSSINTISIQRNSMTTSGTSNYVTGVALKIDVFSVSNKFSRPVGVIFAQATGSSGMASNFRTISTKIMKRVVTGLYNENAF